MRSMGKRHIAVVAALVALAFSAGLAQSGFARVTELPPTSGSAAVEFGQELTGFAHRGPFGAGAGLTKVAEYIGITEEQLRTELQAGKSLAEIAVENGKTRDGLIAALAAAATEKIGQFVDQKGAFGSGRRGGPGGPGFPGKVRHVAVAVFEVASDYLGIEREALLERVRAGESLGEIADDTQGKSRDGLVDAIVAATNAKLDEAVANGRITEEQAAKMRANSEEMAERLVDGKGPFNKEGFHKPGLLGPRGRD